MAVGWGVEVAVAVAIVVAVAVAVGIGVASELISKATWETAVFAAPRVVLSPKNNNPGVS